MGYVYVIGPAEAMTPVRVKIGATDCTVQSRLKSLQTGSPVLLKVLWTCEHPEPFALEALLHGALSQHRSHGEWFTLGPDPMGVIGEVLDSQGGPRLAVDAWAQRWIVATLREAGGPLTLKEIYAQGPAVEPGTVRVLLNKLQRKGLVRSPKYGTWELANRPLTPLRNRRS
jgi:Meiotically up-regulated gene 113